MSSHPNHLSPVDILLQNYERQQIQGAINAQYDSLRSEMNQEARKSLKDLKKKKKDDINKNMDTLLNKLINQGLAKTIPDTSQIPKPPNQKGKKKLPDEIRKAQYFKLTREQQLDYDKKMATEYDKKGLGPYRSFKRQKPINKTKKARPSIVSMGPPDGYVPVSINTNVSNILGTY